MVVALTPMVGFRTCVVMTATPSSPNPKLNTKIESKDPGTASSTAKASNGPMRAPAASMVRWIPNAVPQEACGVANEIMASRGPVRRPLPSRSINRNGTAGSPTQMDPSRPARVSVDRP